MQYPDACPTPESYEIAGHGPKSAWWKSGTIVSWTDGTRQYKGLVRGDGKLFSYEDKGVAIYPSRFRARMEWNWSLNPWRMGTYLVGCTDFGRCYLQ